MCQNIDAMADPNPTLSVVIPVYNEKDTVLTILAKVRKVSIPKEIIVVDNCSTDGTREILQGNDLGIDRLILQPHNKGKGASVRAAIPHLNGEFMMIQDGDLEYNPEDFHQILKTARTHNADAVYGSRIMQGVHTHYKNYYAGVMFLTLVTNLLFGSKLTDTATTYKCVRTTVLRKLKLNCSGFDLDFELTNKLLKAGVTIQEVPVFYNPRTFAEGKKIRTVDGLKALFVIVRDRVL